MKLLLSLGLMALGLAAQTPLKLTPVDQASYPEVMAARHGMSRKLPARGFDLL